MARPLLLPVRVRHLRPIGAKRRCEMAWKFWKRKREGEEATKARKLPRPTNIPEPVGRYLVVNLGGEPDWVWRLKSVVRPRGEARIVGMFEYLTRSRLRKGMWRLRTIRLLRAPGIDPVRGMVRQEVHGRCR